MPRSKSRASTAATVLSEPERPAGVAGVLHRGPADFRTEILASPAASRLPIRPMIGVLAYIWVMIAYASLDSPTVRIQRLSQSHHFEVWWTGEVLFRYTDSMDQSANPSGNVQTLQLFIRSMPRSYHLLAAAIFPKSMLGTGRPSLRISSTAATRSSCWSHMSMAVMRRPCERWMDVSHIGWLKEVASLDLSSRYSLRHLRSSCCASSSVAASFWFRRLTLSFLGDMLPSRLFRIGSTFSVVIFILSQPWLSSRYSDLLEGRRDMSNKSSKAAFPSDVDCVSFGFVFFEPEILIGSFGRSRSSLLGFMHSMLCECHFLGYQRACVARATACSFCS
jgi:hypothetical protein